MYGLQELSRTFFFVDFHHSSGIFIYFETLQYLSEVANLNIFEK